MSKQKNPRSRWVAGNVRYNERTMNFILNHYREQSGWYKGARVTARR